MAQDVPGADAVVYGDQGAIRYASHGAGGCVIMPEANAYVGIPFRETLRI